MDVNLKALADLLQCIQSGSGFPQLRSIRDQCYDRFRELLRSPGALLWTERLNQFHDELIKRTILLSERRLLDEGMGPPPVCYAFVLFGSGGRGEQTLWSDQDNGLIYEDRDSGFDKNAVINYFQKLSEYVQQGLESVGYPPCDGQVLCSNPQWRKGYSEWLEMINQWFEEARWEDVRYLLIAADMRCVYGSAELAEGLKAEYSSFVVSHPYIMEKMLRNTLHHRIMLNVFGRLVIEPYGEDAGGIDIKYGAYIPMINAIRLLAILGSIQESSTLDRVEELRKKGILTEETANHWITAFSMIVKLRAMTPLLQVDGMYSSRGKIRLKSLSKEHIQELKYSLRVGRSLQHYVNRKVKMEIRGRERADAE